MFLHHVKLDFPKLSLMKQDINHSVKRTFLNVGFNSTTNIDLRVITKHELPQTGGVLLNAL